MSWHFSQALEAAFLEASSLGGEPSAPWNSMPFAPDDFSSAKMKATCHRSPYGTMFVPSEDTNGEALLTWFLEAFRAKTFPRPAKAKESPARDLDSGTRWPESLAKYDPATCSWKTAQFSLLGDSEQFLGTWPRWGLMLDGECWETATLAPIKSGTASGLPRRPNAADGPKYYVVNRESAVTRAQNPERQMMLIHKIGLHAYMHLSKWWANPPFWEAAMGWPIKWTDSEPLETVRFQQWLRSHGEPSLPETDPA